MENSILSKNVIFNSIFAGIGTFFTYLFGGWDMALQVLIIFIVVDIISGVFYAGIHGEIDSKVMKKGLMQKALIMLVLIMAVLLDRLLNKGTWVFRTAVCYFYIAEEGISILENIGKCGVPLPPKLISTLNQLKGEDDKGKENIQ